MRFPRLGLLRDRDYRLLFVSTTISQFGFHLTQLLVPLVAISSLHAGPFEVGLLSALRMAPFLLIGLPAGAWVDRIRRRGVLIAGDLGRAAVLMTVPLAWWAGTLTHGHLYAVAFTLGVFTVFFDVAYQSYLPQLIGKNSLVEGNAKLESMRAVAELAGPALAGQLLLLLPPRMVLVATALAVAASALFIVRIRRRETAPPRGTQRRHLPREIGEGLRFVLGHRLLRPIAVFASTFNLFSAAYAAMLLIYLERVLGLDAGAIGMVLTTGGAGGLLGVVLARRFAGWVGQGPAIWMSIAFTAPFMLLMPLIAAPGWRLWVAAAGGFVVGTGVVVYNVTQVSFRQGLTPDHLLGRMNATMRFLVWGTMPLGGLLGGLLGEWFGVRTALLVAALGLAVAFLPALLSPLRTLRTLPVRPERPPEQRAAQRVAVQRRTAA